MLDYLTTWYSIAGMAYLVGMVCSYDYYAEAIDDSVRITNKPRAKLYATVAWPLFACSPIRTRPVRVSRRRKRRVLINTRE